MGMGVTKMESTKALVITAILVCILGSSAQACYKFADLNEVGKFYDTGDFPLIENHGVWGWVGYNYYQKNKWNFNYSLPSCNTNWNGFSYVNHFWEPWSNHKNYHNWSWKYGKCGGNSDGGGEIPEPTCTILTLAGTSLLCLFRRKQS